jgi:hypothetical protein
MSVSSTTGRDAFSRIVQRHREEDSPSLPIEVGLFRMLDAASNSTRTTAVAADAAPDRPADPHHPARSRAPIASTVPELRHLLAAVFTPPLNPRDQATAL